MKTFLRVVKLIQSVVIAILIAIVIPAWIFGAVQTNEIIFLASAYFFFMLGSIWNALRYGQFSAKREEKSVSKQLGWQTSIATFGLWLMHLLAILDFSRWKSLQLILNQTASQISAAALIVSGTIIIHASTRTLGHFFDRLKIKADHQLVTHGIYSAVRHPVYLSYILLFSGTCLLMQSLYSLILLAIAGGVTFGNHIQVEEAMLKKQFGKEFEVYQTTSKKLFPFIY